MKLFKSMSWMLLAVGSFFLIAAGEPQCARSSDRALAPGIGTLTVDPVAVCQRACDMEARVRVRIERKRHRLALRACNGDNACREDENQTHETLLVEIEQDRLDCRDDCVHSQGSASGGQ